MKLKNETPFTAAWLVLLDKEAAENLILVVKATYSIGENGALSVAEKQDPIRPIDEFSGEPGQSSILYESEMGPPKPSTDVVLVGSAVAPRPGTAEMDVSLRVGPVEKRVRVFGERRWTRGVVGASITRPKPFETVPLCYENAYGGRDTSPDDPQHHGQEPRNPVGRGYRAKKSRLEVAGTLLPNLEDPDNLLSRPDQTVTPQGFGFVGRDWQPRIGYAGTYDEPWMKERIPLLPPDFDERFHNAAAPSLTVQGFLHGNEPVEVVGCTRERLSFHLPGDVPSCSATRRSGRDPVPMRLNTVLIDADQRALHLLWKGNLNVHGRLMQYTEFGVSR